MSGPSGWNSETLYIHFSEMAKAQERLDTERIKALETWTKTVVAGQKNMTEEYQRANEHWQENANKWRELLSAQKQDFFPRNLGYLFMAATIAQAVYQIWKQASGG